MPGHDSRLKDYKNSAKHEEMRRRRAEGSVELRKAKRDEQMMKRRNIEEEENGENTDPNVSLSSPSNNAEEFQDLNLKDCAAILLAQSPLDSSGQVAVAAENIRRKLSRSVQPPIKEIITMGLVKPLIGVLEAGVGGGVGEKGAFEAAWALTNIVSGTSSETRAVVEAGGVGPLIAALSSPSLRIAEQAAWALGNVAGDGGELREVVLKEGVMEPMIRLASGPSVSVEFLRTLAWAFSNFCRHKNPPPSPELIRGLLPYMGVLLAHTDKGVRADTAWALSYCTDGDDEQISIVLEMPGILDLVLKCLEADDKALKAPALRTLGNIVSGSDVQTQAVIDTGLLNLPALTDLLRTEGTLAKEAVWLLSNVLAGKESQIAAVVDSGLISRLPKLLAEGEGRVRHEAAWALLNLTTGGKPTHIMAAVAAGALTAVAEVLLVKDNRVVGLLLEALEKILAAAKRLGKLEPISEMFEEAGGLDKLEELQTHEDASVYTKAASIVTDFFSAEEDEATEVDQDLGVPSNGFQF